MAYEDVRVQAQKGALFETPIVTAKLTGGEGMMKALEEVSRQRMAEDPGGLKRSNVGGWHSDTHMVEWGGPPARALADKAIALARRLSAFANASHDDFDWWAQMWVNISGPGASNHLHIHPGNLWSAVLYLDMGGDGEAGDDVSQCGGHFYFEDPRFPIAMMHNTRFRFVGEDGQPQPVQPEIRTQRGDLIMFPAWLRHGVRPYHGSRERISIAINVDAIPR